MTVKAGVGSKLAIADTQDGRRTLMASTRMLAAERLSVRGLLPSINAIRNEGRIAYSIWLLLDTSSSPTSFKEMPKITQTVVRVPFKLN
jgi:hypothetical protein